MDDRLRLLARWHARRRDLDTLLAPLLAHGPAAVERVTARLSVLRQAREAERLAFEAFAAVTELAQAESRAGDTLPIDELARARRRAATARAASLDAVHPELAAVLTLRRTGGMPGTPSEQQRRGPDRRSAVRRDEDSPAPDQGASDREDGS